MSPANLYTSIFWIIALMLFAVSCNAESERELSEVTNQGEFNEQLAEELGADNYGMKRYVMAFLKAGPNRDQDEETAMELQRGHMANINKLADEGKLILAGPFLDGGELRGIFLFDVETVEEARALTETDPAVQAGRLIMELHPWYGSAALMKTTDIHRQIARENP
jgi:uncharacterized protein